jgi:glycosyltransferase involved in cell wall biosynthesis
LIVCHNATDQDFLRSKFIHSGLFIHRATLKAETWALHELVEAFEATDTISVRNLAVVPLGYVVAPSNLLDEMVKHHERHLNAFTEASDVSAGVAPAILTRRLFDVLPDLVDVPSATNIVRAARDATSRFRGNANRIHTDEANAAAFSGAAVYGRPPRALPLKVPVEMPGDVAVLQQTLDAVERSGNTSDPWGALSQWRDELCRATVAERQGFQSFDSEFDGRKAVQDADTRRVLIVSHASALSGSETTICRLVSKIPNSVYKKHALIGLDGSFGDQLRDAGVEVQCANRDFAKPIADEVRYLVGQLRDLAPTLVHVNGPSGLPIFAACAVLGIPVVQHARNGIVAPLANQISSADAIIAVSDYVSAQVRRYGIPPGIVHVIHNGLDIDDFRPGVIDKLTARATLGVPAEARLVTMIARFDPMKRHDLLIRAVAALRDDIDGIHILLNGEDFDGGRYYAAIQGLIEQLHLGDCVSVVPFVDDIRIVHGASDALVLCSENEGMGTCILEAMAMGVPVIASDGSGNHEVLTNGCTGLVVNCGDEGDLWRAIKRTLTDREFAAACALRAREYCVKHLTAEICSARLVEVYDSVIQRRRENERAAVAV